MLHTKYKPTTLQSKTGLKNGERKLMDPSRSASHSLHKEKRALHINNVQLPHEEDIKYLRLYLDSRNTVSQNGNN
jgi:hypothetical protein